MMSGRTFALLTAALVMLAFADGQMESGSLDQPMIVGSGNSPESEQAGAAAGIWALMTAAGSLISWTYDMWKSGASNASDQNDS